MIHFAYDQARPFIAAHELENIMPQADLARRTLEEGKGPGAEFTGWVNLPEDYDRDEFARIQRAAETIRSEGAVLVVIGIGGSYLGARAVIEALSHSFPSLRKDASETTQVLFCGHQLSGTYLSQLLEVLDERDVYLNVISKSGTTTEPAVAFRILRAYVENRYGEEEAAKRIYVTTDKAKGALKPLAKEKGYETFVVPDEVGGRYSVLTAVGLLPIAAAGLDISKLLVGARKERDRLRALDVDQDPSVLYAAIRNILYRKGYQVEIMVNYEPGLHYFTEWWKQLNGESEGKDQRGIFPAGVDNTTDLHSMGQYIQDGRRFLFETVVWIKEAQTDIAIPESENDQDGLGYLAGRELQQVNEQAMKGTVLAHVDGGVPNLRIELDALDEEELGALIYFCEKATAISGYMNAINPFDQEGVESYKKNMFALLGKPGFEEVGESLSARLSHEENE